MQTHAAYCCAALKRPSNGRTRSLPLLRLQTAFFALALATAGIPALRAAPGDTTADAVLGQANFTTGAANAGGTPTAASLNEPRGLVVDRVSGRLFVPDSLNHRVLSWVSAAAFTNGQPADLVLGQPDFTSSTANQGGGAPTARTLNGPKSVATDSAGRLYVADSLNVRILRYDPPLSTNMPAVSVFGQAGSFTTANQAGLMTATANNLSNPDGIAIDANDRLYCADRFLSRVTIYSTPLTSTSADTVIGQPNLTSAGANLTQTGLDHCSGVALDAAGNLYVGDEFNNRVTLFLAPLSNGKAAARVYGQPNFTSNTANNGGISASTINFSGASATVAVDAISGSLYVSDALNHRVLEIPNPLSNSVAARVLGQPNFTTGTANTGGRGAGTLSDPAGVALDSSGALYVSDRLNHRVLRFDIARADVSVVGSAAPNAPTLGNNLTFTATITNAGPDPATNVSVTDTLPAGATLVSASASQGTCTGSGPVTCALGTIAAGSSVTVTLVVTPTQTGTASLTATVAATEPDSNPANNTVTAATTVNAPTSDGGNGGAGGDGGSDGGNGNGGDGGDGGAAPDADGDGVRDQNDNCPDTPNPDQADANADGIGDECEGMAPAQEFCGLCGPGVVTAWAAFAPLLLARRMRPRRGR
jgi:uncharacterized repeat protein (TIGR01451 family)